MERDFNDMKDVLKVLPMTQEEKGTYRAWGDVFASLILWQ